MAAVADRRVPVLLAWVDLTLTLVACLLVGLILISAKKPDPKKTDEAAGSISVYVFWKDGVDLDIDTHLSDAQGEHVYFHHKSGKVWDLLRDDLGVVNDGSPRNFENAYARGPGPGHYIINVAAFRGTTDMYPAEVEIEIRFLSPTGDTYLTHDRKIILDRTGEEITAFAFDLDERSYVIPDSINNIYQPLADKG